MSVGVCVDECVCMWVCVGGMCVWVGVYVWVSVWVGVRARRVCICMYGFVLRMYV